jgi:transcriptional regulator with XRE-family HTH domain
MSTLRVVPTPAGLVQQVAAEVRAYVARAQLSQHQLAEILGIPQSSVSRRLRGKTPFRVDELEKLAGVLGVHPAVFLGVNTPQPPPPTTGRYRHKSGTGRNSLATSLVDPSIPLGGAGHSGPGPTAVPDAA